MLCAIFFFSSSTLDLDGTLTNSKKQVTENTKAAVAGFIDAGGTVVLASGRPTFGVMPVAKILELEADLQTWLMIRRFLI